MNAKTLLISIAAGLACVLAVYSAMRAGVAAFPLLVLSALPIYVATLGWGTNAGVVSSITAIFVTGGFLSFEAALVIGLGLTIPASLIGHQANLAQEMQNGDLEWYPLPQLFLNLSMAVATGLCAIGYMMGYETYVQLPQVSEAVAELLARNPTPTPLTEEEIRQLTETVLRVMPFMFASIWLISHVVNLHLGAVICRNSGIMPRPKDDIPATAGLPKAGLAIMLASLLGCMIFENGIQAVCAVFAGVFVVAYALIGLAGMHLRARTNPSSMIFLVISYLLILVFFIPLFLFAVGGIIRTFNSQQNPASGGGNT